MLIKLKYYGIPMNFLSSRTQSVEISPGSTIEDLILSLKDKTGGRAIDLLKSAAFMVNRARGEKNTILRDGDEVIIMYTLAGG